MIAETLKKPIYALTQKCLHIDYMLFSLMLMLMTGGLYILYSASNQNTTMMLHQLGHLSLALVVLMIFSSIPPHRYKIWSPWIYAIATVLLLVVMVVGHIGKGAQRWLHIGFIRMQPSEIMKLAMPMMMAWFFDKHAYPYNWKIYLQAGALILIPTLLIAKQPDLGTAIMVMASGCIVLFIAGFPLLWLGIGTLCLAAMAPILWMFMHDYQRMRIITLFNPERDPLGTGYHIIQSKIAIGSGGLLGKGWLHGSQAHLNFLPEHATDFIFSVGAEEFGLIGMSLCIFVFFIMTCRCLYIAAQAQTPYTRFLATSLSMTFFLSVFVNIGMVMGILPVVGIPLPLISYGGTAMVTFIAGFGILMSISMHKILFDQK